MRRIARAAILAGMLVVPMALASIAVAQTKTDAATAKQGQMAKKSAKKPKGVTGITGTTTGTLATELTAAECTTLGGTVHDSDFHCKSGKYCGTTDENGTRHRVCLEAAQ